MSKTILQKLLLLVKIGALIIDHLSNGQKLSQI